MNYLRCIILSVTLMFGILAAHAQDIHFSQFYASPLTLNPALTGYVDGACRAGVLYRSQWGSVAQPFVTISGSYEHVLEWNNNTIGVGGVVFSDQAGAAKLSNNSLYASGAFHKILNPDSRIIAGLQLGYIQRSVNLTDITFPDQWDQNGGVFNPNLPNNENTGNTDLKYYDLNAGVLYVNNLSDELGIFGGLAFFHLLGPKESFLNSDTTKLPLRLNLHGGARMALNEQMSLHPNFVYMLQKRAFELNLGASLQYDLQNDSKFNSINAGAYYRNAANSDAIILMGGIGFDKFIGGISYDLNISSLTAASSGFGGPEISIRYICPIEPENKIKVVACPRY